MFVLIRAQLLTTKINFMKFLSQVETRQLTKGTLWKIHTYVTGVLKASSLSGNKVAIYFLKSSLKALLQCLL